MCFFKLIITILLLVFINSLLNKVIKILKKKENNKKYSESNNKLNSQILVKKYIETFGKNIFFQDDMENISVHEDKKITLICYKDLREENEKINKNYIMAFISNISLERASKGVFIYNGKLPKDIEDIINKSKNLNFTIEFIDKAKILSNIINNY